MKSPSCGSENMVGNSEKRFPVLCMTGKVWYCSDCKLMWSEAEE